MTEIGQRRALGHDDLVEAVVASFDGSSSARLREVMQALVRHLHAFAREVRLSEAEWFTAVDFLTRAGHITDAKRQEFILLSDVLGLSMQVVGINHDAGDQATESTVFGPFFVEGSPRFENGDDLARGFAGEPCFVSGRVLSTSGEPIAGARIEVWQSDAEGLYDVQRPELDEARGRGHLRSDPDGRWWFWSVRPVAYPIPHDGPVGDLLAAAGRGPMRPAHVHFMVSAPGYRTLITHVFVDGDEFLDSDAVFGVRDSLIASFDRHPAGAGAPDGTTPGAPFSTAAYDLVLAPERP